MKRRRWIAPACACALLGMPLVCPALARRWADCIALPLIRMLRRLGGKLSFSLLEYGLLSIACILALTAIWELIRRRHFAVRLLRRLTALLTSAAIAFGALWLPLYARDTRQYAASADQMNALCAELIALINESEPDFALLPELPAKPARFPEWMRRMNLSGFYSFITGEAFIAPDLPRASLPFVAVHEAMHGEGIAGEGEANIAAWARCMELSGAYADSARLWALKYAMAALYAADPALYAARRREMSPACFELYRQVGGKPSGSTYASGAQAAFSAMGAGAAAGDYEILAVYLASQQPLCYN